MRLFSGIFCVLLALNLAGGQLTVKNGTSIDFGEYPANQSRRHTFVIVNDSDKECKLGEIRSTCGCTAAELDRGTLKPGEKAELNITLKANSLKGKFAKTVYVETDMNGRNFLRLVLSGDAVPLLKAEPDLLLYVGVLTAGKSYEYEFKLTPLQKDVKLEFEKAAEDAELFQKEGVWYLKIKLTPEKKDGRISRKYHLKVVSPADWEPVVVWLHGRCA